MIIQILEIIEKLIRLYNLVGTDYNEEIEILKQELEERLVKVEQFCQEQIQKGE